MSIEIKNNNMSTCETLQTISSEIPIESDYILSEMMPDSEGILKCFGEINISNKTVSSGKLYIEGNVGIKILYLTTENRVASASDKIPFSKSLDIKNTDNKIFYDIDTSIEYINCRQINSRRFDIRGAFAIKVQAMMRRDEDMMSDASGDGIQMLKKHMHCMNMMDEVTRAISVMEEFEISKQADMVDILYHKVTGVVTDYKFIANKIIVKGKANLYTTICDSDGDIQTLEHMASFSTILEVEGIDENSVGEFDICTCSSEVKIIDDIGGGILQFEAEMLITAKVYTDMDAEYVEDVFSTKYDMSCRHKRCSTMNIVKFLDEERTENIKVETPENMVKVCNVRAEICDTYSKISDGSLLIECKILGSIVGVSDEGKHTSADFEQFLTFNETEEEFMEDAVTMINCKLMATSFAMDSSGDIELKVDIMICGRICEKMDYDMVCDAEIDESSMKMMDDSAIAIYFAEKGENIWMIAKRYNTSPEWIMRENNLESFELDNETSIIIPLNR